MNKTDEDLYLLNVFSVPQQPPITAKVESTDSVKKTLSSRDPRLRRSEQEPDHVRESRPEEMETLLPREPVINEEILVIDNRDRFPIPISNRERGKVSNRPSDHVAVSKTDSKVDQKKGMRRNVQHMAIVEEPALPVPHAERLVTESPKHGDFHRETKPKNNHRKRNPAEWPSHSGEYESALEEPVVSKSHLGRGKVRKGRRKSLERQRGRGGRGRGPERKRELVHDGFQNEDDQRFTRIGEPVDPRYIVDRPGDSSSSFRGDWNSDVEHRDENFRPRDEPRLRHGKRRRGRGQTVYVRGRDHDEIMRSRSPGIAEQRVMDIVHERDRVESMEPSMEPRFAGPEIFQDPEFRIREEKHLDLSENNHPPFHSDPREQHIGEPHPKKPRPLLSDMEINELRNRKGASPNAGRMTPPHLPPEGFLGHPLERGEELPVFDPHMDGPFHPDLGPAPHGEFGPPIEHHGMWEHGFEIPRELMLDRQNEIMRRVRQSHIIIWQPFHLKVQA